MANIVGGGQQCQWYREISNTIFERELCTASQQNGPLMSQLGQKLPWRPRTATSGLPLSTDIYRATRLVRFVPEPEVVLLTRSRRRRGRERFAAQSTSLPSPSSG